MHDKMKNKKIIIAGSEGLIGKKLVKDLQGYGATVISLDMQLGHDFVDENTVKQLMEEYSDCNVLITPFAINPQPGENNLDMFDIPLSSLEKYLKINITCLFSICREFARHCAKDSSIINFSSIYGIRSPKHYIYGDSVKHIGYTITKSAILGLSKYLATYLAPNIRVNTIVPGGIYNGQDENFVRKYSEHTPFGRMMKVEEVVGAVLYLASDMSLYTTGAEIVVDGGWSNW